MTILIITGALLCFLLLMTGTLFVIMLIYMHRGETPAELACCPMFYGEDGIWEGSA